MSCPTHVHTPPRPHVRFAPVHLALRIWNHASIGVRRAFGTRLIERSIHDYRLLLDAADPGIHRQLLVRGMREPEQRWILLSYLTPGMRVFDLGANVGYYAVMMAKLVGEQGHVYAVEPHPANYELLQRNLALNALENVTAGRIAIDVESGERTLLLSERCNWHSLHDPRITARAPWVARYRRAVIGTLRVPAVSLRRYLEGKPPLDLVRMDLEGYEVQVLRALGELPPQLTRRLGILMETHPEFYDPVRNDMRSVLKRLRERHGYRARYVISDCQFGSWRTPGREAGWSVFARRGYTDEHIVQRFAYRAIYADLAWDDAADLICTSENVHAAFLAPDAG